MWTTWDQEKNLNNGSLVVERNQNSFYDSPKNIDSESI